MQVIDEETGGEDVAAGDIGLNLGEIAEAQDVIVVGVDGKCGVDEVVVLAVEGVVEPHFSFLDWAREGEAGEKLVEAPSVLVLNGGNEVGGEETEVIVADAGVQAEQAAGSFAGFGGLARGLDLDGAERVGADADQKLSVGGLRDVEAIEQSDGLVGLRSGDVRLAVLVLHDSGNEIEDVAIVVGAGIDDVDDVEAADGFLRRRLARDRWREGIRGRRRFRGLPAGARWRLRWSSLGDLDAGLDERVEAFFFDAELVWPAERGGTGSVR